MDDEDDEDDEQGEDANGDGRQTPQPEERPREVEEDLDEEGAHAAFVAGMIWALSRRVLPGPPYVPGLGPDGPEAKAKDGGADLGIRWRLDECLRCGLFFWCLGTGADGRLGSRPSLRVGRPTAGLTTSVRPARHRLLDMSRNAASGMDSERRCGWRGGSIEVTIYAMTCDDVRYPPQRFWMTI